MSPEIFGFLIEFPNAIAALEVSTLIDSAIAVIEENFGKIFALLVTIGVAMYLKKKLTGNR